MTEQLVDSINTGDYEAYTWVEIRLTLSISTVLEYTLYNDRRKVIRVKENTKIKINAFSSKKIWPFSPFFFSLPKKSSIYTISSRSFYLTKIVGKLFLLSLFVRFERKRERKCLRTFVQNWKAGGRGKSILDTLCTWVFIWRKYRCLYSRLRSMYRAWLNFFQPKGFGVVFIFTEKKKKKLI